MYRVHAVPCKDFAPIALPRTSSWKASTGWTRKEVEEGRVAWSNWALQMVVVVMGVGEIDLA